MQPYKRLVAGIAAAAVTASGAARPTNLTLDSAPLPPASVQAPIALLADLSSGQVLFARKADQRFLPASMTKAMSALVAFDLIAAGALSEDAVFTVRPATAARWAGQGTTLNLRSAEQVLVRDLLMGTTIASANDAAVALAEGALGSSAAWTAAMNARAASLGMSGSHFATPNGYPDRGATYTTANDLLRLAGALIDGHPALYQRYFGRPTMRWRGQQYHSHDPFAAILPGADGIKTGHSYEAGFNFLGAVERHGRRLVLVVGQAPTEPGRAAAAKAMAEWGYGAWRSLAFLSPGFVVGAAQVQNGTARQVQLAVPRAYSLAVPNGFPTRATGRIVYDGPLAAPITKGQHVARLEVNLAGQPRHILPLVAARAVGVAGPFDRIANALLGLWQ